MGGETEPVAQRTRQRTGTGGRAHQRERRDIQRNRRGTGTFPDHDVDAEILHREVEHLLGRPGDAVDLVDEQHIVLDEVRQHRREIAGPLERRARGHPQRRAQFGGDDHRQRRLAQAGRAGQQDVIRCATTVLGALDDQLQLLANPGLADELPQRPRTQAGVDVALTDGQRRGDVAVLGFDLVVVEPAHLLPSIDSAARNARRRRGLGSLASTLSVASSACLTAKPSPTSASTTGPRTEWPFAVTPPATGRLAPILSRRLEHHPLGAPLADSGHPGQRGDVAVGEGLAQASGASYTASVAERDLGPDAGHSEQREEQVAGVGVGEAVQRHRVLAHDHRGDQAGLGAAPQRGQRRWGRHHLVADAGGLDDDVVECDVENFTANGCDHRAAFDLP